MNYLTVKDNKNTNKSIKDENNFSGKEMMENNMEA
jgi:hypothetical protein